MSPVLYPRFSAEDGNRVDGATPAPYLEVEVRGCDVTCGAAESDKVTRAQALPVVNLNDGEVRIHRFNASGMVDLHDVAEASHDARETHRAVGHRLDGCARRDVQVHSSMNVRPGAHESQTESGGEGGVHRPAREVAPGRPDDQRPREHGARPHP